MAGNVWSTTPAKGMGDTYHHLHGLSRPNLLNCTKEEACKLAAADELLAALQALQEVGALNDGVLGNDGGIPEAQEKARAAIAKASIELGPTTTNLYADAAEMSFSRPSPIQQGAVPTRKTGKPLTERMVESLVEMKRGTRVETEEFFSWPRWKYVPGARHMALGCPPRAMLEGLDDRGLLSVSKNGRKWVITVNEAGLDALLAHEQAQKNKKPSPFKEYGASYAVTNSRGTQRVGGLRVKARTENEVIAKVKTWLKDRHIGEQVTDIRIDWRPTDA